MDLARVPDEYLIAPAYDAELQDLQARHSRSAGPFWVVLRRVLRRPGCRAAGGYAMHGGLPYCGHVQSGRGVDHQPWLGGGWPAG